MGKTEVFCPDWVSAPGETIGDILREQRVSIDDFAGLIGHTRDQALELLVGRSAITIGLARRLEHVLGGSVEFWMSRDFQYRKQISSRGAADNEWLQELPLNDMVSFGWLEPPPDPSEELSACLMFFGVPNVAEWHRAYGNLERRFSFRTSRSFESRPAAVAAWLRQGEIEAAKIRCAPWTASGFEGSFTSFRSLTPEKDPRRFVPRLQQVCADAGVAVAVVRSPSGCRASGATRFITKDKALLLLSFRYLSDDQFWFSFFHEAGHLLLHSHKELFIEGIEAPNSQAELEADDFAYRALIPPQFESDMLRLRQNKYDLVRFARRIGVSPGIVVGQLQHHGKIRQNHFNGLKRRYEWERY
jgi:HTH-type transcriptional regulator / antitoxin HigA